MADTNGFGGCLWDYLESGEQVLNVIHCKERLANISSGQDLLQYLQKIESILDDVVCAKSCWQSVKRWLFNRLLGTAKQMRVELETQFKTKRIQIKSFDGTLLDCFLILGQTQHSQHQDPDIGPTVLFCNPNAGYYEYMYYESEWIEYYSKRDVNLMMWNYRGYGDSEGYPSTAKLQKDAEFLVDFMRDQLKVKLLGVHGESLGGMIAVHVAKTRKIDFLFADRTFSSLSTVAELGFSKVARFLFNLLTDWNYDSSLHYTDVTSYKLIAYDPRDEVIPVLASL